MSGQIQNMVFTVSSVKKKCSYRDRYNVHILLFLTFIIINEYAVKQKLDESIKK